MSLYSIKPGFVRRLRHFEDGLVARRISPDALTLSAVVASVLAGGAIAAGGLLEAPMLWLAVPPLVLVRLALNALDGSVARRTRTARPLGAALNEIGDRVGDAATVGATAFAVRPALAFGALASCFLASSTGVLAQATIGRRDNGGPMGKADRAALLAAGAAAGAFAGSPLPLTVVVWVIAAGGIITAAARLGRIRATLDSRAPRRALLTEGTVDLPSGSQIDEEMLHALCR